MSDTHELREDAQRLIDHPDCVDGHIRNNGVAELVVEGTSLAPSLAARIAEMDRHIIDVTTRTANTVHVEMR